MKAPKPIVFLAGFTVTVVVLSIVAVILDVPDEVLILLIPPVIFAGFRYPRWVYLSAIAVLSVVAVFATHDFPPAFDMSFRNIIVMTVAILVTCEVLHFLLNERLRLEQSLRESESKYRMIADNISDIVWTMDLYGKLTYISPAIERILGRTIEATRGRSLREFLTPDSYERAMQITQDGLAGDAGRRGLPERPLTAELEHFQEDGSIVPCETSSLFIRDEEGCPIGVVGVTRDISERRRTEAARARLEARLQDAQKLESLGTLTGKIAHDFNNLLMGILGNAEIALTHVPPESPAHGQMVEITNTTRFAADLCSQMLSYAGKGELAVRPLDLSVAVRERARLVEVAASKKSVVKYSLAEALPAIEGDPVQIGQVIMNLVINASDAIGDRGGFIAVTTGCVECNRASLRATFLGEDLPEGKYVYLDVSDTGSGMDQSAIARIFDPYFTTKPSGRGLGLAAVFGIVRDHRGAIQVVSSPNKGAAFRVFFSASERPVEAKPLPVTIDSQWRGQGTILVIDDEVAIRIFAETMLTMVGFEVITAIDGREGVEIFSRHAKDIVLVILDMTMPRMGGEETFYELRRIKPEVPILLSSGYAEIEVIERFTDEGLAGFIQKPYQVHELIQKLQTILEAQPKP